MGLGLLVMSRKLLHLHRHEVPCPDVADAPRYSLTKPIRQVPHHSGDWLRGMITVYEAEVRARFGRLGRRDPVLLALAKVVD